jgi:hypothetical protein
VTSLARDLRPPYSYRTKKAREAKADDRRERRQVERKQERDTRLSRQEQERTRKAAERARKEAERLERALEAKRKKRDEEYERIALPRISHDMKLTEAAKRLGEDIETLRAEFAAYYVPDPTDTSHIEPWEAPVDTRALLQELVAQTCADGNAKADCEPVNTFRARGSTVESRSVASA